MIKLVYCFARAPHLSHREFSEYWKKVHGPIGAQIPGVRKLVQSIAVSSAGSDLPTPAFDGMAELWFDDLDALAEARRSPQWQASTADEANFIDLDRTSAFVTTERKIV